MKLPLIIISLFCYLSLISNLFNTCKGQTSEPYIDPAQKYDELLNKNTLEENKQTNTEEQKTIIQEVKEEKDELFLLFPKLDSELFQGWSFNDKPIIWLPDNENPPPISTSKELLLELGVEKILKQFFKKEEHLVDAIIYKFKDFAGAYSAYTILHSGATTKLKVGKNASESDKLVNFWKGNYFVDINTPVDNDTIAKEFIILSSQDISKNIKTEQLPPIVAIQLPSLYRVQGTEKYCLGSACCKNWILKEALDFNCDSFDFKNSGGLITAEYQLSEDSKDKERITLLLSRFVKKEDAQLMFSSLKEYFENKQKANKDIDIDFDIENSLLKIKFKKDDYTMLKQRGNLLAIVYFINNKKSGEQIINLVPWPIEITKPGNTLEQRDER